MKDQEYVDRFFLLINEINTLLANAKNKGFEISVCPLLSNDRISKLHCKITKTMRPGKN